MSDRYNRPRTPPSPPPSSGSRKTSTRGLLPAASSKGVSSKSYGDHPYDKYDKDYKSSANYQSSSSSSSSKQYSDSKYKSEGKSNEKPLGSKYASKSVNYDDNFKLGSESRYSSQRYTDRDATSAKYSVRGRYAADKYTPGAGTSSAQYNNNNNNKKYDDYVPYPDKPGRYIKQEPGSYYGSSYDSYGSYEAYGADGQRGGTYANDRLSVGTSGYGGDKFGGGGRLGGGSTYTGAKTGYGGDKYNRGGGYGGDKLGVGGLGYGDGKSTGTTARSGLYNEDRRSYRSYSPSRTARSPLRNYSGSYDDYGYPSSSRNTDKQYLDRYVIGNSVVYGPPGQYPRNLTRTSMSPGGRPPSPPSPPMMQSRGFNRYSAASPRKYSSGRRSVSPPSSSYQNLSSSSRRPPSPPSKRPPSPDSIYMRDRDRSYDTTRSKESKINDRYHSRSPLRDTRSMPDRREGDRARVDDRNRRDDDRRLGSREKTRVSDEGKRGRIGDRRNSYRGATDIRTYTKDSYSSSSQNHKDDRNQQPSPNRGARRDSRNEGRDRGRRLEDRLGVNPSSGGNRRSPVNRSRMGRNAASPRDGNNKRPRRPDDLRLWIESRKNDMGKKGMSQSRGRPGAKGIARSGGDRSKMLKRSRLGDPKRRLGNKAKRAGGGGPMKRNKILNKYRRLAARRGVRSGGGGRDGGGGGGGGRNNNNRSNRDTKGVRKGNGGGDGENDDSNKPGSTASIRRVIKKPKRVSQVNNLEIKPRIMGKPIKKLLKDPKQENDESSKNLHSHDQGSSHHSSREASREDEKLVSVKVEPAW